MLYGGVKVVKLELLNIDIAREFVKIREQANEIRDGILEHFDTNASSCLVGNLVLSELAG